MDSHTIFDNSAADVMNSIRRLVRALRVFDRAAERRIGLSGAQVFILHHLRDRVGISVNELAVRTCTDQSSVSVVVQKLVDQNLVTRTRSAKDGRRVELSIAPAGLRRLNAVPTSAQERIIAALQKMPASRRRQLARGLQELVSSVGLERDPATLFFEDASEKRKAGKRHTENGKTGPARPGSEGL